MRGSMTHWTPTPSPSREPFYRLFESLFNQDQGEDLGSRTWAPPVDVAETDDAYIVKAEVPGMKREDLDITLENNVLRISGERKFERDEKKENYHRIERSYGAFSRAFALPSQVDSERVEASFNDGVLAVTVPKAAQARPRKIQVA